MSFSLVGLLLAQLAQLAQVAPQPQDTEPRSEAFACEGGPQWHALLGVGFGTSLGAGFGGAMLGANIGQDAVGSATAVNRGLGYGFALGAWPGAAVGVIAIDEARSGSITGAFVGSGLGSALAVLAGALVGLRHEEAGAATMAGASAVLAPVGATIGYTW